MKNRIVAARAALPMVAVRLLSAVLLFAYLNLFKQALIDDAFITLRYVKTLLSSGTWGFFPGLVANSATSPLNVILLTLVSLFTGPRLEAALWLYFLCLCLMALLLERLSLQVTGSRLYGWLAVSALIFNPLLVSTMGIESIVFATLFVSALYCYQNERWTLLAIVLGLLTLTRPEGGLYFLLFLLFMPGVKPKLRACAAYLLCILPWYLFSWIHLGSFLPDTFFIKTEESGWQWDFFSGITGLYYYAYRLETILSFLFLPLGLLLVDKKTRETRVLVLAALAGLIHFVGYSLLKVPPFHWYYAPEILTIVVVGSLGLGQVYGSTRGLWARRALALLTVLCFLAPAIGMVSLLGRDRFLVDQMPIHSNWATAGQYKQIGLWLKENHRTDTIRVQASEIGTIAYYCDCRLLDWFSDRSWLRGYMERRSRDSAIAAVLLKINFAFYSSPAVSSPAYTLRAYGTAPGPDVEVLKQWDISTKWVKHALVVLSSE